MECKINVVELATMLAEEKVLEEAKRKYGFQSQETLMQLVSTVAEDDENCVIYKDYFQEVFNTNYDYYFELILTTKTNIDD